jgi:pyruvate/2-oxoacid:ferredoxin oxidoreductase beta subunit
MAMSYGNIYVAEVAMGARDEHTLRSFLEAESFDGPSLIIAYSHCIAHGINMVKALDSQKAAVGSRANGFCIATIRAGSPRGLTLWSSIPARRPRKWKIFICGKTGSRC